MSLPLTKRRRQALMIIVPVQVCLAVLAWRDIGRRSDRQLRGRRGVWRVIVVLNPGNALLYWLFGRR